MKVRIIHTSQGYICQFYDLKYGENRWWSISRDVDGDWSHPEYIIRYCTIFTLWGAKRVLKEWIKRNIKGTAKLKAFAQELDKPNVVYEAEV